MGKKPMRQGIMRYSTIIDNENVLESLPLQRLGLQDSGLLTAPEWLSTVLGKMIAFSNEWYDTGLLSTKI